jgi:DNA-binding transcriptional ArsR family regulator
MDALQVVAEPRRREILRLVWAEEASASEIAARFDVTFPAVSQHLGVLRRAGFVSVRREGTRRFYRAVVLQGMWASTLDELATLAEEAESTDG